MSKRVWIVLAVFAVAALVVFFLFRKQLRASPPGKAELSNGGLTITVDYSRPSVNERMIFGTSEEGALVPYGKYWRLGANEATEISFSKDVTFNDKPVKSGTYSVYAIPGAESFSIVLNSDTDKSGAPEPDHSHDVVKVEIPVQRSTVPLEKFTISLEPMGTATNVIIAWSTVRLIIPVTGG